MRKMKEHEMKSLKAGADPALVECVCAFMDAGMDYGDAREYCKNTVLT